MAEKTEKTHKIIRLETENVKRIHAVSIRPDSNIVELTGKNKAGKSSIMDSIWLALGGIKDGPSQPIRKGQKKAKTEIETDNGLIIRRTFNRQEDGSYTSSLIVETTEGMRAAKPQDMLNMLVGALSFDPFEFVGMDAKEQFNILKRFVPDFDFQEEADKRKKAFTARTDENRRIKELKAQANSITVPEDTPEEEISVSALADELQKIADDNAAIERRKNNRAVVAGEADRYENDAEAAQNLAKSFRERADAEDKKATELHAKAAELRQKLEDAEELPAPADPAEVRLKMSEAEQTNTAVRELKRLKELQDKIKATEAAADALTKEIDASDARRSKAISSAKIPVPGIGFGDDMVLLNDLPFDQASTAEQLSAAVQLVVATKPRFRVILVRDASLLDEDSWKVMEQLAIDHDFQLWIETVRSDNPSAIHIVDGMVLGAEVPPAEAEEEASK